jgi:hypothetical protein
MLTVSDDLLAGLNKMLDAGPSLSAPRDETARFGYCFCKHHCAPHTKMRAGVRTFRVIDGNDLSLSRQRWFIAADV